MAPGPITSWQIDVETVADFIFGGLPNHCRWWLQPWNQKMLTPWKESYDQPRQHIKKQRHTLPTKVCLVKAMVFLEVMYGYETWTIKKAEGRRINAFELWCWRRLLRVPWTARRTNQSILKINPGCSLEGLILKLKLQYFGHLMWRADSFEKALMLGKIEGRGRRGWQRMRWLDGTTNSMDMSVWTLGVGDGQGGLACCCSWGHKQSDTTEWLNWTELNWMARGKKIGGWPLMGTGFLFRVTIVLYDYIVVIYAHLVNILKPTEFYTLKQWIL